MVDRIKHLPLWTVYGLLAYMPFHVLLSQWLSTLTGGLVAWKVAKDVFAAVILLLAVILVYKQRSANRLFTIFVYIGTAYFALHLLTWLINPEIYRPTALLGTLYNNRLLGYLLLGMGAVLLAPRYFQQRTAIKLIIGASTLVCVLGLLQYFLPKDLMTHFGYSIARGVKPAFFIDDKPDLPRIMSTLRDPNSLGGYLVTPITLLVYKLFNAKRRSRMLILGLLILHALVLMLTFSRSALMATIISVSSLVVITQYQWLLTIARRFWAVGLVAGLLIVGGTYMARDQYFVQHVIFHSDESTTAELDSNDLHLDFAKKGVRGIVNEPLGHGPGTAGIVSIQNPKGGLLTEDYYIQIGYEVGLLGLGLLLTTFGLVYWRLKGFTASPLALVVLASFWGYAFMALLTHLWTNEAIAAQWWLVAGISLGLASLPHQLTNFPAKP